MYSNLNDNQIYAVYCGSGSGSKIDKGDLLEQL